MIRLLRKIKQQLILLLDIPNQILIYLIWKYKRFDLKESIVIFSEARGGSTWLMEILNALPNNCINWEPLHVAKGVVPKKYKFGSRPFIPHEEENKLYSKLFKEILSFSRSTKWSRKHLSILKILKSKFVITKFVRANLLIPYIFENYEFEKPPIFLIRHPIDTCLSAINTFVNKRWVCANDDIPDIINNNRYKENIHFLSKLETRLEISIANWCLNNVPTLNNSDVLNKMTVVFYYDLILDPETQIQYISNNLGLSKKNRDNLLSVDYKKPSFSSVPGKLESNPTNQINKNFNYLSSIEKDKIQMIFDYFDFKLFDAYSPEPNKQFLLNGRNIERYELNI